MVIGLFLLILAIFAAGVYTYESFNRMLQAMDTLSKPEAKLVHLNEVMTEISNAEGSARAYTLTKERHYLRSYWDRFSTIEARIQQLQEDMQGNAYQRVRIDSVAALLQKKQDDLQSFLILKDKEAKNTPLKKALKIIDQKANDSSAVVTDNQTVTPPIKRIRRKGFRQIVRSSSTSTGSSNRLTAEKPTRSSENPNGELLNDVKDIIHDMEYEELRMKQYLGKQELGIIEQDWLIMDQIRSIIKDVRREELLLTETNAAKARYIATSSVTTISAIGGFIFFGCFIFLVVVFKDLTRSNYYRTNLIQSKRRAEKLAQVKEEFLANMSHEIRTPLNAITGFLAQLKKTTLNRDQHLYVDTIESSSDHLLSIVNDILDLSKIESGKLAIESQPFTVKKVLQTVVDVMRVKAQEKDITISREMDPALNIPLMGDAHRLRQILFNLVGNAVKFTDQGGVSVRALTKNVTDTHVRVEFSVEDTGAGIATDKLEHIFGAFNQEDGTTGPRYGGTGLGLAICKKLVELQSGWIAVESVVGRGSIFSFVIEFQKSSADIASTRLEKALPLVTDISNKSILLVDDDHVNRLLLEVLSEKWDAQVDIVESGLSALSAMEKRSYDMVLTDINMPEMNGVDLMLLIKKTHPTTPVIAFTATVQPETLDQFLAMGFDDYLLKPFKEADLCAKIAQYSSNRPDSVATLSAAAPQEDLNTSPTYSLADLKAITRGNPKKLIDILELIVDRCPAEVDKLVDAANQQQWIAVAAQAHKLRSSFGQVEANGLVHDLHLLEARAMEASDDSPDLYRATQLFAMQAQAVLSSLQRDVRAMEATV